MNLKKNRKLFTSKFLGTGSSSSKIIIYRATVSPKLRNTTLEQKSYYTHHSNIDVHHYVCTDVLYDYSTD